MRKSSLIAMLLMAGTIGNLQAEPHQGLRSGGCSDLYGSSSNQSSDGLAVKHTGSRVRFVSTNGGETVAYPVGLFRKGGCSSGGCLSGLGQRGTQVQYGPSAGVVYYQAAPMMGYQAPVANSYQGAVTSYQSAITTYSQNSVYAQNSVMSTPSYGPSSYGVQGNVMNSGAGAVVVQTEQRSLVDCGPVSSYKVVLEPKFFTESRAVCSTEYQTETRYRTRTVARTVPVETQDYRTVTVMVPRSETKTIEYSVLVPQTSEKTVEVLNTVPVWTEVPEQYTVKVPSVIDVPEQYTVKVPQLVDQEFTYTVQVPQALTETRMQAVTNAIPVTKTRTVQNCTPVTRMQTVTKDSGHWEDRVEEVTVAAPAPAIYSAPAYSAPAIYSSPVTYSVPSYDAGAGCGSGVGSGHGCRLFRRGGCGSGCGLASHRGCGSGCGSGSGCGCSTGAASGCASGGCGSAQVVYSQPSYTPDYSTPVYSDAVYGSAVQYSAPTTQTVTRRVWVPNVVTEQVPVVENVMESQEVAYTVYEQQTEQVPYECTYLVYRPETRTGTRKVVNYIDEARTRTRKVVRYNDETRTRILKKLSYKQETRTETIPVVSYTNEKRTKEVSFTFNVPETKVEPFTSTRFETVNEEVSEEYTVTVPVASTKEVQVQVCRMVPKLVPITIYPCAESQSAVGGCANGCGGSPMPNAGCSGCSTGCDACK